MNDLFGAEEWCRNQTVMTNVRFNISRPIVFGQPDGCPSCIQIELPTVPREGERVEIRFTHEGRDYCVSGYARCIHWDIEAMKFGEIRSNKIAVYIELGTA